MLKTIARVAFVPDNFSVVLNKGLDDGIELNDKFLIFGIGSEIVDPDTGESLGALEVVRGRVRVEHLQAKLCTARSVDMTQIPGRKRILERKTASTIAMAFGNNVARELIETEQSSEERELVKAAKGDYARPI